VEEQAFFFQACVKVPNKWASALVPHGYSNSEIAIVAESFVSGLFSMQTETESLFIRLMCLQIIFP